MNSEEKNISEVKLGQIKIIQIKEMYKNVPTVTNIQKQYVTGILLTLQ